MEFSEDAKQAANYLREAIPLMVKYNIHPNPRNFALWYAYVTQRDADLNKSLDKTISEQGTCPPEVSLELFRRHVINEDADFAEHIRDSLAQLIASMSDKTDAISQGHGEYAGYLEEGLANLETHQNGGDLAPMLSLLLEQTRNATQMTSEFRSQMNQANSEIATLKDALKEIKREASLDALTGINNRRSFDVEIARLTAEASKNKTSLALIVTDIDHFKKCNDTYGHVIGDKVLQAFAKVLQHICGDIGFPARYGGEEFMILLPEHTQEQAHQIAEQIRETTMRMKIRLRQGESPIDQVTTSLGIALFNSDEASEAFVERTDAALYAAKDAGRNCVRAAP